MPSSVMEPFHKQVPQHNASPQQSNFRVPQAQTENFSGFRIVQAVHIAERNDFAIVFRQSGNGFAQQAASFFAENSFDGNLPPVCQKDRSKVCLLVSRENSIERDLPPLAQAHAGFIHGDAQKPRGELGFSTKTAQVAKGFQECFLSHLLCIGLHLQNVKGSHVYAALVWGNQLVETFVMTAQDAVYELELSVLLVCEEIWHGETDLPLEREIHWDAKSYGCMKAAGNHPTAPID